MKVRDIAAAIEQFAPLALQESYDNSGLIVGSPDAEIRGGVLLAVDVTDAVLDEAIERGCDMVITHHPIIFHPLKRLNNKTMVERCVMRAIRHDIALYACHTNLDSAVGGMSWQLGKQLGLEAMEVLEPSDDEGNGFGVVGELAAELSVDEFFALLRERVGVEVVRHSAVARPTVRRVAVCTGSGSSMMEAARRALCDVYVTADLRYNDFYLPDGAFTVVDIGHFESEFCAINLIFDILSKTFINFAPQKSSNSTNPVLYHTTRGQ